MQAAAAQRLIHEWQGESQAAGFGTSLAQVGDLDGGGTADILVAAPYHRLGAAADLGAVSLFRGEDGTVLSTMVGQAGGEMLGLHVAAAGDLDGDGRADVLVGSGGGGMPSGQVRAFAYAPTSRTWRRLWARAGGHVAASLPDMPGGRRCVLVGDVLAGRVDLLDGRDGTPLRTWLGPQQPHLPRFGETIAATQDLDGDGFPEVLIGAPAHDTAAGISPGVVFLYSGGRDDRLIRSWRGEAAFDYFGASLQRGPDVDGDGFDDVLVGAPMPRPGSGDFGPGKAYVYSLRTGALLHAWTGHRAGDSSFCITRVGDVNGDTFEDLALGSPTAEGPLGGGRAELFSGRDLTRRLETIHGSHARESLGGGFSRSGSIAVGDLDGDGYGDFAVPSRAFDGRAGSACGRVQVFAGGPLAAGVWAIGRSSRCCPGPALTLSVTSAPSPGNVDFAVTCSNVPRGSVGLPVLAPRQAGWPFGCVTLIADPWTSVTLPIALPDARGNILQRLPLPGGWNGPAVCTQVLCIEVGGTCGPFGTLGAASNALAF